MRPAAAAEPAAHGRAQHTGAVADGHQDLREQDRQGVQAEEPHRQRHRPQRGRGLVDGDGVGRVQRAEEEGLPGLAAGLDGRRVEGVGVAGGAQVAECRGRRWRAAVREEGRARTSGGPRAGRATVRVAKGCLGSPDSGAGGSAGAPDRLPVGRRRRTRPGPGPPGSSSSSVEVRGHRAFLGSVSCGRTGCSCMVASPRCGPRLHRRGTRCGPYGVLSGRRARTGVVSGRWGRWRLAAVGRAAGRRRRSGDAAWALGRPTDPVELGLRSSLGRSGNTQARKSRNRSTVAARLAAMRTASSVECAGSEVAAFRAASEPLVRARPIPKTTRPCAWWRDRAAPAAHPEGQAPVGRRVGDRGDQQGERVGDLRAARTAGSRCRAAGRRGWTGRRRRRSRRAGGRGPCGTSWISRSRGSSPNGRVSRSSGERSGGEGLAHAPHPLEVVGRRLHDVDGGVRVVDPVDGHLVDPQTRPLGEHQHLGVEEPAGVLDQRQQDLGDIPADRLEAALRVREAGLERAAQDQVVRPADELPLGAAHHPRGAGEPGADREVGVAGDQRGHQRQQGVEVGGQVDVHVGEDRGVGGGPHGPQGPAAPLLLQPEGPDLRDLRLQPRAPPAGWCPSTRCPRS